MNNETTDTAAALALALAFGFDDEVSSLIDSQIAAIATISTDRQADLWENNADLAARLAFEAVRVAWTIQADAGLYLSTYPNVDACNVTDSNDIHEAHTSKGF